MSTCSWAAIAATFGSGRTLKPMTTAFEAAASRMSPSLIVPTPLWITRTLTWVPESLTERVRERLDRALHVALEDDQQLLGVAVLDAGEEVLEVQRRAADGLAPVLLLAHRDDLPGLALVGDDLEGLARAGDPGETEDLDRGRRRRLAQRSPASL